MRTSVEIPDALLDSARKTARKRGTTLRALIEHGLRRELEEPQKPQKFEMVTFSGEGLQPEFEDAEWKKIREEIYRGHGA